jgi:hypothetical protein
MAALNMKRSGVTCLSNVAENCREMGPFGQGGLKQQQLLKKKENRCAFLNQVRNPKS